LGRKLVDSNLEMTYAPAMQCRAGSRAPHAGGAPWVRTAARPSMLSPIQGPVVQLQQIVGAIKGSEPLKVRHGIQITLGEFQVL
jgi:hypothetical protein